MKKEYNGNSKKGGVYKITNQKNGKVYIGSAKCFQKRAYQHASQLKNGKHQNKYLQASWNKHGEATFVFEVIEVVEGNKGERFKVEQKHIDQMIKEEKWETTFNFKKKTVQKERTCFSKTPEETRRKKSKAARRRMQTEEGKAQILAALAIGQKTGFVKGRKHNQETKRKMSNAHKGKKKSIETRRRMSKAQQQVEHLYWAGKKHTETTKEKMRKNAARKRPIVATCLKTGKTFTFESLKETAEYTNMSRSTIARCAQEKTNPKYWKFQYLK